MYILIYIHTFVIEIQSPYTHLFYFLTELKTWIPNIPDVFSSRLSAEGSEERANEGV